MVNGTFNSASVWHLSPLALRTLPVHQSYVFRRRLFKRGSSRSFRLPMKFTTKQRGCESQIMSVGVHHHRRPPLQRGAKSGCSHVSGRIRPGQNSQRTPVSWRVERTSRSGASGRSE